MKRRALALERQNDDNQLPVNNCSEQPLAMRTADFFVEFSARRLEPQHSASHDVNKEIGYLTDTQTHFHLWIAIHMRVASIYR